MLFPRVFSFAFLLCVRSAEAKRSSKSNLRGADGDGGAADASSKKSIGIDLHGKAFTGDPSKRHRQLQDLDWELNLEDEWPQILFDATSDDGEVRFKYNYTGTMVPNQKFTEWELLRGDCLTAASPEAVVMKAYSDNGAGEITFDIDVLQATITNTPEYIEAPDGLSADIVFCVRGDYFYGNAQGFRESVNFHETNVTITADLTANFTLTAVNVDRIAADQAEENVAIDCSVTAYFCDEQNNNLGQPTFSQGDIMTVCVEVAQEDVDKYHLDDVIAMNLQQDKSDGSTAASDVILNRYPSPLSSKQCRNGVCNMRHLIQSKFFDERNPQNLDLAGIALCGFGPVPSFTDRKGKSLSAPFINDPTVNEVGASEGPESIAECEAACILADCQSFVASPVNATEPENDLYTCTYYDTHPTTEVLQRSATDVYMRNPNPSTGPPPVATP